MACHFECMEAQNELCEEMYHNDHIELYACRARAYDYCNWYCTEGGGSNSYIRLIKEFEKNIQKKGIKPD